MFRKSSPFIRMTAAYTALGDDNRYRLDGRLFPGMPDEFMHVSQLKKHLLNPRTRLGARDRIWRFIIEKCRATSDDNWSTVCFGLARPGLVRAVNRAHRISPEMQRGELEDEALQVFIASVFEMDLTSPGICSRLCQAVFSRLRSTARDYLRDFKTASRIAFESRMPPSPCGHVDLVLADAVREQIINESEAHIIGSTRIDGIDLAELADELHTTRIDLHLIRKKAEHRLVEWLQV